MITSKQRAFLRGMASQIETTVQVGKNGVSPEVAAQAMESLEARELVKFKVLENAPVSAREAAVLLAENVDADIVQVIGGRFVLYRKNPKRKDGIKL